LNLPTWRSEAESHDYARSLGAPSLYGYSPSVIPKPPDWDEYHHVTGYWFLDAPPNWQPSAELTQFLDSGSAPVYIGFGSMSHENPERQARLVLRALELSGQRGVLLTGWGGLTRSSAPPTVFFVDDVPHAWLFPRMAAVVHHGGAGTTSAGLRAGVPNLITPFGGDQIAWADRVVKLGVGLQAGVAQRLTAEKLAKAIHTSVNDSALRARATALGERIRAEDGVAHAVEVLERHAARYQRAA
jgi:sterol 3beta-glucosyltransferase